MNSKDVSDCTCDGDCAEVLKVLYEYVDGQMPDDPATKIRAHVCQCEHCANAVDVEQHLRVRLRCACSQQASAELRMRITNRLQETN